MKFRTLAIVLAIAGEVFAMAQAAEAAHDVDWYKTHATEREATLKKCHLNAGELEGTANCVNAGNAASAITWGARGGIVVKPVTFGGEDKKPAKGGT